jgi:uncharacterized protein
MAPRHHRREFMQIGSLALLSLTVPWTGVAAQSIDLDDPDPFGVRLPAGHRARLIAASGQFVANTPYRWHAYPDGGGTFTAEGDGGWFYVSNSEANGNRGGASAIEFNQHGEIAGAARVLDGLKWACAGGVTPWGTWLACEEYRGGYVWECDPTGATPPAVRPALGKFIHEAAVVDPVTGFVYQTEDEDRSRLYCFRPNAYGDLTSGMLLAASLDASGRITWVPVADDRPDRSRNTTAFARLEGAWFDSRRRSVFFTTTTDNRVWALDVDANRLRIIYDGAVAGGPLFEPDNITLQPFTGDLFVAEDNDNLELVRLTELQPGGAWVPSVFLRLVGHENSEVAGPAFSPDGRRLYFSSQRGVDGKNGMTFEVTRLDGGVI